MPEELNIVRVAWTLNLATLCQGLVSALQTRILQRGLTQANREALQEGIIFVNRLIEASNAWGAEARTRAAFSGAVRDLRFFREATEEGIELAGGRLASLRGTLESALREDDVDRDELVAAKRTFSKIGIAALDGLQHLNEERFKQELIKETT